MEFYAPKKYENIAERIKRLAHNGKDNSTAKHSIDAAPNNYPPHLQWQDEA